MNLTPSRYSFSGSALTPRPRARELLVSFHYHSSTVRSFALETSLWKLSAGFAPSFLETGWLARQFPRYTLAVGNSALDLTRVSWKPAG